MPEENKIFCCEKNFKLHHIYINGTVEGSEKYTDILNSIFQASDEETIVVHVNTCGGDAYTTIGIVNALLSTEAKTIANINVALSAGSMIAMACDEIRVGPFARMLVHSGHSCEWGKPADNKVSNDSYIKFMNEMDRELFKGFMTEDEIKQMSNGKEVWFNTDEICKRLKKWTPMRKRKCEKKKQ